METKRNCNCITNKKLTIMKQEFFFFYISPWKMLFTTRTVFDYMRELIEDGYHIDQYMKEGFNWSILAHKR